MNGNVGELAQGPALPGADANNPNAGADFDLSNLNSEPAEPGYGSNYATIVGDFVGSGALEVTVRETVPFSDRVRGVLQSGGPTDANSIIVFEHQGNDGPDDFFSAGPGTDADGSGDANIDTFAIAEPLPPNEVLTSPGPEYQFDGGTAVWVGNSGSTTAQPGPFSTDVPAGGTWLANYSFSRTTTTRVPGGGGAAIRRLKLSENNSPIPRDRWLVDYNYFKSVRDGIGDVNRFILGGERTFLDGLMSLELRIPFARTLNSDQFTDGRDGRATEFGNMTLTWKGLLDRGPTWLVSSGIGIAFPTADDTRLFRGRSMILEIQNEAWHLTPFLALLWTPRDRWFVQNWVHMDIDTAGNAVIGNANGQNLSEIGTLNEATLLFADISVGYWLVDNRDGRRLDGIAPVLELHYSTTTNDQDTVSGNGFNIRSSSQRYDILNLTVGTHFRFNRKRIITPGFIFPLRDQDDRRFDCEFALLTNWYY